MESVGNREERRYECNFSTRICSGNSRYPFYENKKILTHIEVYI